MEAQAVPPPVPVHPVSIEIPYEVERNRLTAFFRLLILIPWIVVGYVYAVIAMIAWIVSWFALLFTASFPRPLYNFLAGYNRFYARLGAYATLATDALPPFWGGKHPDHPVRVSVGAPQRRYSRAKTFFKFFTAIPQFILGYGAQGLAGGGAFVSWWRIVFTGKQSATMNDAIFAGLAYSLRSNAFVFLLTEVHPRVLDLPPLAYPPDAPGLPGPEQAQVTT